MDDHGRCPPPSQAHISQASFRRNQEEPLPQGPNAVFEALLHKRHAVFGLHLPTRACSIPRRPLRATIFNIIISMAYAMAAPSPITFNRLQRILPFLAPGPN